MHTLHLRHHLNNYSIGRSEYVWEVIVIPTEEASINEMTIAIFVAIALVIFVIGVAMLKFNSHRKKNRKFYSKHITVVILN